MNEDDFKKLADEMEAANKRLNEKLADLEEREAKLAQERAAMDPQNPAFVNAETNKLDYRAITQSMIEKRAITINGGGNVTAISKLFEEAISKTKFVNKVNIFYGPNASTTIPVLAPGPAKPSKVAEGATNATQDTTADYKGVKIEPYAWFAEIPVSYEALKMGVVDLEAALKKAFKKVFASAMDHGIISGTGSNDTIKGIFAGVPNANKISCAAAGLPKLVDVINLAEKLIDLDIDEPCIVMSGTVHASLISESTTQYSHIQAELCQKGTILGCKVEITGKAPSAVTAGTTIVVGGSFDDYALGVAAELTIEPLRKPQDTNTYFQAIMCFNGKPIVESNYYGLKTV